MNTIMPYGRHKGQDLVDLCETKRGYVQNVAAYGWRAVREAARSLLTDEEVEDAKRRISYYTQKKSECIWLICFLKNIASEARPFSFQERFCLSVIKTLRDERRMERITKKQLLVIAKMWGEYHSGQKEGEEYDQAIDKLRRLMRRHWDKKHTKEIPI